MPPEFEAVWAIDNKSKKESEAPTFQRRFSTGKNIEEGQRHFKLDDNIWWIAISNNLEIKLV